MSTVCRQCGAMFCGHSEHIIDSIISHMGDPIGQPIISYTDANSDMRENTRELFDGGNPLRPGLYSSEIEDPQTVNGKPMTATEALKTNDSLTTKPMSNVIDMSAYWVACNLCNRRIHINYLDAHAKTHIYQAEDPKASTAMVRVGTEVSGASTETWSAAPWVNSGAKTTPAATWSSEIAKLKKEPTLHSLERYKFRKLSNVCAAASTSKNNRYSDFTVVFWGEETIGVNNSSMYGTSYSSTTYKDWERLEIHTVYDSLEDYYVVSCKLLRRASYGSWDNEDKIPDGIYYQHELMTAIKRALLFFRIDPKVAYKRFRKLFNEDWIMEKNADGKVSVVQTKNCLELEKKLKGSGTTTTYDRHYYSGEYS